MPQATAKCRSTDIGDDHAAFAHALGGHGERVPEPGQIVPTIQRAIRRTQAGTPALLLARTQAVHADYYLMAPRVRPRTMYLPTSRAMTRGGNITTSPCAAMSQ